MTLKQFNLNSSYFLNLICLHKVKPQTFMSKTYGIIFFPIFWTNSDKNSRIFCLHVWNCKKCYLGIKIWYATNLNLNLLFQNKTNQSRKKNLIFFTSSFVTVSDKNETNPFLLSNKTEQHKSENKYSFKMTHVLNSFKYLHSNS